MLNVGFNDLEELPQSLGRCMCLRAITAPKNALTRVPLLLRTSPVRSLDLSLNLISEISPIVCTASSLENLSIVGNPIKTLPSFLSSLRGKCRVFVDLEKIEGLPLAVVKKGIETVFAYLAFSQTGTHNSYRYVSPSSVAWSCH